MPRLLPHHEPAFPVASQAEKRLPGSSLLVSSQNANGEASCPSHDRAAGGWDGRAPLFVGSKHEGCDVPAPAIAENTSAGHGHCQWMSNGCGESPCALPGSLPCGMGSLTSFSLNQREGSGMGCRPRRFGSKLPSSLFVVLVLGLFGCGDQSTQVPTPSQTTVEAGAGASVDAAGSLVLSIRATLDGGEPARGVSVGWSVSEGSGTLSTAESVTDEQGVAEVTWTSDGTAGDAQVRADVPGVGPVMIDFVVVAGEPVGLELSPSEVEFQALGDTAFVQAKAVDEFGNEIGAEMGWSSSAPDVVSVDQQGVVRAESAGESEVSVQYGPFAAAIRVVVAPIATELAVSPDSLKLVSVGETFVVELQALDAGGSSFEVADGLAQWFSGDESVASVNSGGMITAVASGSTTVDVHVQGASAQIDVEVQLKAARLIVQPASLEFSSLGATERLDVRAVDENGTRIGGEGFVYAWGSNDRSVVVVDDGEVTAVGNGKAEIEVSLNGVSTSVPVVIAQQGRIVEVSDITLDALDSTGQIVFEVFDELGSPVEGVSRSDISRETSDPSVFIAAQGGRVRSVGVGTADLTVTVGQVSAVASVSVTQRPVDVEVEPGSIQFEALHDTATVSATALDSNGHGLPGEGADFSWESSDPSVVSVSSSGLVRAIGVGGATITVVRGNSAPAQISVEVSQAPRQVYVSPKALDFTYLGQHEDVTASARDGGNNTIPLTNKDFGWQSSDDQVATVGPDGRVQAVGVGQASISATVGGVSGSVPVTVTQVAASLSFVSEPVLFTALGDHRTVAVRAVDSGGSEIPLAPTDVTWTVSNDIISVDAGGNVSAEAAGAAFVTATYSSVHASLNVAVEQAVSSIEVLEESVDFTALGQMQGVKASAYDSGGALITGAPGDLTWHSSDAGVASVDGSGVVTANAVGSATVTVSLDEAAADFAVVVTQVADRVELSPAAFTLTIPGATRTLDVQAFDSGDFLIPTHPEDAEWSSGSGVVATVSAAGVVSAVQNGSSTITASFEGAYGTSAVTVDFDEHTLGVVTQGDGSGLVDSSPAGIHCGSDCVADFVHGTMVTLTASAAEGSTFEGWDGATCSGTGPCEVTMTEAESVMAIFNGATLGPKTVLSSAMGWGGSWSGYWGNYLAGFQFTPVQTIQVTQLRGVFAVGAGQTIRIKDIQRNEVVASAFVDGANNWRATTLPEPVTLDEDRTYEIYVIASSGQLTTDGVSLPKDNGAVRVTMSCIGEIDREHPCHPGGHTYTSLIPGLVDFTYQVVLH